MRLIDADILEKEGWSLCRTYQKDKETMVYEVKAISEINTAQPDVPDRNVGDINKRQPEIVRCKNCKWYKTNYSWDGKEHKVCVIEPYEPIREGDDFCSRAERRTDE